MAKKVTKKKTASKQERLSKGANVKHKLTVSVKKEISVFSLRTRAACGDLIRLDVARTDKNVIKLGWGGRYANSGPFDSRTLDITVAQARAFAQGILARCAEEEAEEKKPKKTK